MSTTGTQTQMISDPLDFGGGATSTAAAEVITTDATAAEAKEPESKADIKEKEDTKPVEDATKTEASTDDDTDDLTPEEKALAGIDDDAEAPEYDESFKSKFKELVGTEDPVAFKSEYSRQQEQLRMLAEENQGLKALKGDLDKLPPHVQRALELEKNKPGEGTRYLKSLPDSDVLAMDAKKIGDRQLLDTYVPDHGISDDDWAVLKDPDADPDVVSALKKRISFLRQNGEDMHVQAQKSVQSQREADAKALEDFQKEYTARAADELAKVKATPMKAFLTQQHINEIQGGTLVNRLFEADGITPKPGTLDLILKGEQYDKVRAAAQKAGYKKGKSDGLAEQTAGMPSGPRTGRAATPAPGTKQQPLTAVLDDLEKSLITGR